MRRRSPMPVEKSLCPEWLPIQLPSDPDQAVVDHATKWWADYRMRILKEWRQRNRVSLKALKSEPPTDDDDVHGDPRLYDRVWTRRDALDDHQENVWDRPFLPFEQRLLSTFRHPIPPKSDFSFSAQCKLLVELARKSLLLAHKKPDQAQPRRNILLYGVPGTGKTVFAKQFASLLNLPLFCLKASGLLTKWSGSAARRVAALFQYMSFQQPAVLFVDECEALLARRGDAAGADAVEHTATVGEFLSHLHDDSNATRGLFVIAATNLPETVDSAARSRFAHLVHIPPPDGEQRRSLFRVRFPTLSAKQYDELVGVTMGCSMRDITSKLVEPVCEEIDFSDGPVCDVWMLVQKELSKHGGRIPPVDAHDLQRCIDFAHGHDARTSVAHTVPGVSSNAAAAADDHYPSRNSSDIDSETSCDSEPELSDHPSDFEVEQVETCICSSACERGGLLSASQESCMEEPVFCTCVCHDDPYPSDDNESTNASSSADESSTSEDSQIERGSSVETDELKNLEFGGSADIAAVEPRLRRSGRLFRVRNALCIAAGSEALALDAESNETVSSRGGARDTMTSPAYLLPSPPALETAWTHTASSTSDVSMALPSAAMPKPAKRKRPVRADDRTAKAVNTDSSGDTQAVAGPAGLSCETLLVDGVNVTRVIDPHATGHDRFLFVLPQLLEVMQMRRDDVGGWRNSQLNAKYVVPTAHRAWFTEIVRGPSHSKHGAMVLYRGAAVHDLLSRFSPHHVAALLN